MAFRLEFSVDTERDFGLIFDHLRRSYPDQLLHYVRLYNSRSFYLWPLKRRGSESSHQVRLRDFGNNAWSVLRNLRDKRNVDDHYDTIMGYMAEVFPAFDGIVLEQTAPSSVYASFLEKGRRHPIYASGASEPAGTREGRFFQ